MEVRERSFATSMRFISVNSYMSASQFCKVLSISRDYSDEFFLFL